MENQNQDNAKTKTKFPKIKFSYSLLNKLVICLIIVCGMGYVASMNDLMVKGFELQDLKKELYKTAEENRRLESRAMALESYGHLSRRAEDIKMVSVGSEVEYITNLSAAVAKK